MNWEQLLSLKRFGDTQKRLRADQDETRLGFEVDFDRIIFSEAFRSLQDKTQVVPLSETDFVHTRLTHSFEVSVVGRTLGRKVGKVLLERHPNLKELGYAFNDFGAIVAAASVMHDIGNPPFGHSGEKAIGEYFKTGNGVLYKEEMTPKEYHDLIDFEGNANGLKILTENREGIQGGLRLSYATLGAFLKYPKESLPKKPTAHISDKKYGCFQSEKKAFIDIAADLGLLKKSQKNDFGFHRHPLAFLVEAADDICYTIIDFEDGINLGLIEEEFALEYLIKLVKDSIDTAKYHSLQLKKDRVSYLRALAINTLISISKIYMSQEVVEKEVAVYKIISDLLDVFIKALNNHHQGYSSNYDELLLNLLPSEFKVDSNSLYERIMSICSFISRMSDSYATRIHKKISGSIL